MGEFKDELNEEIIAKIVGLRSNLYSYKLYKNKKEVKKAIGTKRNIVKNNYNICILYSPGEV